MILNYELSNCVTIHSLNELFMLGKIAKVNNIKVNKSEIARGLNVDRRTVNKYLNGYSKPVSRNRSSQLDSYYDLVKELLLDTTTQVFFYKRVLWQYLKDNHGLDCAQSSFRRWISLHDEFQSYFNGKTNRTVNGIKRNHNTTHKHMIHYETPPGYEAQLDWKESMNIALNTGEVITINVLAIVYSYSRYKVFQLSLSKTQDVLFHLIDNAFCIVGGIPKVLRTDNMKTVMDEARTNSSSGKLNKRFEQFSKDYGFEVKPCRAFEPMVKAKVESPMKLLDELYAYNGLLNLSELNQKLVEINERTNGICHTETGKIPMLHLQKEKDFLSPLPQDRIRNHYRIPSIRVKVNSQSTFSYKSNFYSVPIKYLNKHLDIQVYDGFLHVYDNTKLVTIHQINVNQKRNYHLEHYEEILRLTNNFDDTNIKEIAINNLKEIGELYK